MQQKFIAGGSSRIGLYTRAGPIWNEYGNIVNVNLNFSIIKFFIYKTSALQE